MLHDHCLLCKKPSNKTEKNLYGSGQLTLTVWIKTELLTGAYELLCLKDCFPPLITDGRPGGGGGGGYSSEFLVGVCRPGLQIPTLFQT